ncbi:MAG: hypothetical protein IFK94_06205 [Acidobacteria bacterium]|uniref:Lipoprotein n=1 Tax=Candidatus Polarisedimenticola svalbardensis TaxID=2886004 RepID=A0A8J6XZE5_9BACT|nr:hypothetical protein [Candidatus Polarisedimenticola svalbardensis]
MKKVFYVACCLVLAMGVGCAITNYELITDDDGSAVNTNGKAAIMPSSQIGTLWPDGMDESFSMVDQKANGDRTLTTYNNHTTDQTFIDWLYCSPDWNGCSMVTASDPEVGDVSIFDFTLNRNCSGLRSLSYVLSTTRYYGECGRAMASVSDRISLMNMGNITTQNGVEGLLYNLNRNTFSIRLDNNSGVVSSLPVVGDASIFVSPARRQMTIDLTNSLLANTGRGLADFTRNYGTDVTTVTFTLNGISKSWEVGNMNADKITANMNKTY